MKINLNLVKYLRQDARTNLVKLASFLGVPKSTVFDRLKRIRGDLILKNTVIVDFKRLGYNSSNLFLIQTDPESRIELQAYLAKHPCVNNLHVTNNRFDFLFEAVFKNNKDMNDFKTKITSKFKILRLVKYELIEDICREKFIG